MRVVFFFNDTATTEIYTLSLHDALPISPAFSGPVPQDAGHTWVEPALIAEVRYKEWTDEGLLRQPVFVRDRKSTRLNSSHVAISYAVFCLKKKNKEKKERAEVITKCVAH